MNRNSVEGFEVVNGEAWKHFEVMDAVLPILIVFLSKCLECIAVRTSRTQKKKWCKLQKFVSDGKGLLEVFVSMQEPVMLVLEKSCSTFCHVVVV